MAWYGGEIAVPVVATKLTTLLGLSWKREAYFLDIRADSGNAGNVLIGPSTVTTTTFRRAYIQKGETYQFGPFSTYVVNTDDVYLIGTVNDICYISGVD